MSEGIGQIRLALHGGAGVIDRSSFGVDREQRYHTVLQDIAGGGLARLRSGEAALDAAQWIVMQLEDCEYFNAGRGAVLNRDGEPEFDAALMRGSDRAVGGVAAIRHSRNPIEAARAVLEQGDHVLLAGEGADRFAAEQGIASASSDWFVVPERKTQLRNAQQAGRISLDHDEKYGTVGAVVRDAQGRLAAATSTGGMTNKHPGRVGDTPLPGSGTWADDLTCAISATGHGEFITRAQLCYDVHARMAYQSVSLAEACAAALNEFGNLGGSGGVIAISHDGDVQLPFNSPGMYRAWVAAEGTVRSAIFPEA